LIENLDRYDIVDNQPQTISCSSDLWLASYCAACAPAAWASIGTRTPSMPATAQMQSPVVGPPSTTPCHAVPQRSLSASSPHTSPAVSTRARLGCCMRYERGICVKTVHSTYNGVHSMPPTV